MRATFEAMQAVPRDIFRGISIPRALLVPLALGLWSGAVLPQAYPSKAIRFFVSTGPGAPPDVMARLLSEKLVASLGQPVIVENRPGASGSIGMAAVAKAPPDGYTIGIFSMGYTTAPSMVANLPYDTERDLAPVTMLARDSNLLVVTSALPAKSVAELVALAKAQPGRLKFASGGNSTPAHLAGELLKREAAIDIVHIPYKTPPAGAAAVLAGDVDMMFGATVAVTPHIRSGRVRVLATATPRRLPAFPDLPTLAELGYPGVVVSNWSGVVAPAGTPKEIVERLGTEIRKILAMPDVLQRLEKLGVEASPAGAEEFGALIRSELKRWNQLVRDAGIKPS
jgi:tripartite-type tricarboxylate transporter receptor subunit TctC